MTDFQYSLLSKLKFLSAITLVSLWSKQVDGDVSAARNVLSVFGVNDGVLATRSDSSSELCIDSSVVSSLQSDRSSLCSIAFSVSSAA